MRRALGFAAVLLGALFLPSTVAGAQTFTVTTTADETVNNGQTSLREAFALANANAQGDTIQLANGANYILDFCAAGPLTHSAAQSLTVQGGAGTSIQNTCAEMRTIVDSANAGSLTLRTFEMTGFATDDGPTLNGAAVAADLGGTLLLDDVEVHGFTSGPSGSIVDGGDNGGSVTVEDSEIYGNQGTGVSLSFGTVTLLRSDVDDNEGRGVGLVDGSPLVITDSSVSGNSDSGATTTGQGNTVLQVTNSQLNGNGSTGLSCSNCATVTISGSGITGNGATASDFGGSGVRVTWDIDSPDDAPTLSITGSTIAFNRSVQQGGGVHVGFSEDSEPTATPGVTTISGSNVSANSTDGAFDIDGGGIYVETGNLSVVSGSTVNSNRAGPDGGFTSADGGGIWHRELANLNGTRTLTITDSTVSGNEANDSGGGVYVARLGAVDVTGSTLNDNRAGANAGGGMSTAGTVTNVTTSRVQGNDADVGGGLAHQGFSGLPVGSLTVTRSTLSGNTSSFAASGGGGVFVNVGGGGAQATLRNTTVTGNTSANLGGGVMVMQTSRLFLDHATVVSNTGASGSNVFVAAAQFRTRRAAIALGLGAGDNCDVPAASTNDGFSWADDTSCNLGPNDVEAPGVDPQLGPLAANGGPTPTRKPEDDSPLVLVPPAACTIGVDQRGITRPQGDECEAGAVEIDEISPK